MPLIHRSPRAGFCSAATVISVVVLVFVAPASAATTVFGPVYPMPGYNDAAHATHGGSTCLPSGTIQGSGPLTWSFGGSSSTTGPVGGPSCDGVSAPPAFDTTRFQALYWGLDPTKSDVSVFCGSLVSPGPPCPGIIPTNSGPLVYDAADSAPANGKLVYQGSTDGADKLTMTFETFGGATVPLVDASTIGTLAAGGPTAAQVRFVVAVTPTLRNFKVIMSYVVAGGGGIPTGNCNCHTQTDIQGGFYWVDRPPTGDFTFPTPANHEPLPLTLGTLADPDGTVASYSWDLNGDGTYGDNANQPNPSTATLGPGTHTVGLQIVDNDGTVTNVTHTFTIVNQPPTGTISILPPATDPPANNQPATFRATVTDPDQGTSAAPTYAWDMTGGTNYTQSPNADATATFGPGTHTVAALVTDSDSASTRITKTFTIADKPPTGDFTYPTPANHEPLPLTVGTLADPDGSVASYSWDLNGDGTYGDNPNTPHPSTAPLGPGRHTVGLQIIDNDGTVTNVIHTFTIVNQPPTGTISILAPATDPPANHRPATFHATVSDPDRGTSAAPTYAWDMTGGTNYTQSPNADATAAFGPGSHTVAALVTDSDGARTRITKTFSIVNKLPVAGFSCTPPAPVAGKRITCTATDRDPDAAPGDPVLQEKWDWNGNGTTSDSIDKRGHVVHGTLTAGWHKISLHVIDRDGGETIVSHGIFVKSSLTLSASLNVVGSHGLQTALLTGLVFRFTANQGARATLVLSITGALSHSFGLGGPVGNATPTLTRAGSARFKIRFSEAVREELGELRSTPFMLSGVVRTRAGKIIKLKLRFSLH